MGPRRARRSRSSNPGRRGRCRCTRFSRAPYLEVTEPTKVTAEVDAAYKESDGSQNQAAATATLRVYDRNAMTWDDDRKAAAFVSAKDPWVLDISNNVSAMVRDLRNPGVVKNLQTAIAFHDALRIYGLAYSPNPSTPYSYTSTHPETVDFLKFPRQTLTVQGGRLLGFLHPLCLVLRVGGDRDRIHYRARPYFHGNQPRAVPGRSQGPSWLSREDLIFLDGKSWLPIETTIRDKGLLDAWREGAREWRQGVADKTAAFYPIHEAWKIYPPVGLAADGTTAQIPAQDLVRLAFGAELSTLVDEEISLPRRIAQRGDIQGAHAEGPQQQGRGVREIRPLDMAEKDFLAALNAKGDYVYALLNLGNIATLRSDHESRLRVL